MDAAIFGLIVADVLARPVDLRNPPAAGGMSMIDSIELHPGGNVCNVGIAMSRLGATAAACGVVGDDALGAIMVDRLKLAGVDIAGIARDPRRQTSATVVAIDASGERCFFHTPGATQLLDADAFRRCFPIFRQCAWLQIGYFGLLPHLTAELPALLQELGSIAPNTRIALDTVNPPAPRELLDPILPHVDLFAPSRTEAQALTGEASPDAMIRSLRRQMPGGIIAIKLDADGCVLDDVQMQLKVPGCRVDVVDTTGAGDTWFGALLVALRHNMPLELAGRIANRAAADCCTAVGASTGVRSFQETLARAT